jgi:hypothetical protein
MLTWIVAHSDAVCNFFLPLLIGFSPAQQRHALNVIEALLVCPFKHKTLAGLTRLLGLPHADEFALADFFRVSPWDSQPIQQALPRLLLRTVCTIQQRTGWRLLFLSVDDALCPKDVATQALDAVSFHYDHVQPRRQSGKFTNASCYVMLHLQLGPVQFTLSWRLYLKRKQVQKLKRQRAGQGLPQLTYRKMSALVEEMLTEIAPQLPQGCHVYVLFDAWYDNHHLLKFIRRQGWHWICATRSNRVLSERPVRQWWGHLNHQRIERVSVHSATRSHTYATRHVVGRLRRYPDLVVAIISKRERRDLHPAYFLCSDVTLSVRCMLKYYGYRWQTEVDNRYLKERFGLADYRVHSIEAIQHWHVLVFAAYAFVQYQRALPLLKDPHATLQPLSDVLAAHQHGHVRQTVCQLAALVREGKSDAELLKQFALT